MRAQPKGSHYIRGLFTEDPDGEAFTSVYPATGEAIATLTAATSATVDRAVAAARAAQPGWAAMLPAERGRTLRRAAELIRARNAELSELETLDTGKPIQETLVADAASGADCLEYFGGLAAAVTGQSIDLGGPFAYTRREPLGVCAGIGAWNYPIQIAMWKSAPALACGNTMIFKPAELTPLTALKLAEIYTEAGLPDGVFNVVQGDGRTGQMLSRHPGIAKISLTGEVGTGKRVMADAAQTLKHVTFELGGKSPLIIFADADFDSAVNTAMNANFYSGGEVCSNGTRVFVGRPIYQAFLEQMQKRVPLIKTGDPFDPDTRIGALINADHMKKVMGYLDIARASNALHVVGGERLDDPALAGGNFVTPAVFADCTDDMQFVREEIFGAVMAVLPFDSEEEVLNRANDTPYGLSGAVFTQDFARAHRVANAIQAGSVWINDYNITPPEVPFGGQKQSGIGRENGLETINQYTQSKTIYANLTPVEPYF